jgi:hypothetical protein
MPAPRKQSPSSPATNTPRPGGTAAIHPAVATRIRQLAAQAEHSRAIADYHARHLADQQARTDALLLEAIAALAALLGQPDPTPAGHPDLRIRPNAAHRHQDLPERERGILPNGDQTT